MNPVEEDPILGISQIFREPERPPNCFVIFGLKDYETPEEAYFDLKKFGRIVDLSRNPDGAFFIRYEKENGLDKMNLGRDIIVRPLYNIPKADGSHWLFWNWRDITPDCKALFAFKSTITKAVDESLQMAKVMNRDSFVTSASKYAQDIVGCPVKPFGPYSWKIVDQDGDIVYFYVQRFGLKEVNKLMESNVFNVESWEKGCAVATHVFTGMKCVFVSRNEVTSADAIRQYCEASDHIKWQLILLRKWWAFNYPPSSLAPGFFILEWMMLMFLMTSSLIPPIQAAIGGQNLKILPFTKDPVRIFVEFLLFYLSKGVNSSCDLLTGTFVANNKENRLQLNNPLSSSGNLMAQISRDELLLLLHKFDSTMNHLIS